MTTETNDILSLINTPDDLRKLDISQLPQVCNELRKFIIDELSHNPGHFASSLGAIELTVALHYTFKTPYDRIVWDVGHQAYSHKILTGRKNKFCTNRKFKGLSGFPTPLESEFDTFTAGHASNSISAALGMAVAANLKNEEDRKVVAVIGDASISGGLAFEGLNNASTNPNNLLIILNDNDMAIDHNVGALNDYLVHITTSPRYNRMRYKLYLLLRKYGLISEAAKGSILRFNNSIKALISKRQNIFEGLNIRYFGPIDGHDVNSIVRVLNDIKEMKGPKILHLRTIKGKGYSPAEKSATEWHAPGKFDKDTGIRIKTDTSNLPPLFQDVFGETLVELARNNEKIVGITPAMPTGCSMTYMMQEFPQRTFDVGIAEEHAVTFSGGLAKEGLLPYCNIYSTFMQRAYDQIIHDVAIQNLHVIFCIDRAGLVGEDGVTHHGAFDLAYLRCIPNMTIASPMNEHYLRHLMFTAQAQNTGAFAIRYPRGRGVLTNWKCQPEMLKIGKGRKLNDGKDIAVLSIGPIGNNVQNAIKKATEKDISVAHYDMIFLKPIDTEILHEIGSNYSRIVTVEDGVLNGGFGSAVIEFMADNGYTPKIKRIGIPDRFIEHGSILELRELCHMDDDSIARLLVSEW
ncbi:1-deoxy-D-xylulose-5-phosphate synthase [Coprobacter tertius]|uniref:1-deoxy-D-xylulose-5-phosphate synthase n=1 Tax=Coprobacter tertius TaxID=2944915 RepID=A0ABT1MGD4_9BACT|nr:1-deoxy-D-xylulose-5-phosphate synthase [Coprobacter tertius]MCP9611704.1 1-deoxy-D-xylulose-5-phosphate synthase [Coprobacter tertius]